MGATPASIANAASEWIRPGWDQVQSTVAATIGPTPSCSSRSGRQERTIARIAFRRSAASLASARARRANERNAITVVVVSTSHEGWTRRPAADQHAGHLLAAEPGTDGFGCSYTHLRAHETDS